MKSPRDIIVHYQWNSINLNVTFTHNENCGWYFFILNFTIVVNKV